MPSIELRIPLTPEEQQFYEQEFKKYDPEDLGIVTGESVKSLFGQSGLSPQALSQIWSICDTSNQGFLNLMQFSAAMRSIGHLQINPSQPVSEDLYQAPAGRLPSFGAQPQFSSPPSARPALSSNFSSNSANATTGSSSIPPVSAHDVSKFSQLFDRFANGAPVLAGDKAKEVFLKAKLSTPTLGSIWALCDRNNSGSLDKTEFVMAMHLIQTAIGAGGNLAIPNSLPAYMWNSVDLANAAPTAQTLSVNSTGISAGSSVTRNPSIARVSSGTFSNAASDWTLTYDKRKQFDAIFDSLDKQSRGTLGSQVLVPFFLSSRLNQDTLAAVWDLADIHNSAEFSKLEFAIAMFLIQKKNSGIELPDVVPDQLLHSPALGLYESNQPTGQSIQAPVPHAQPSIPSRDTKPSFSDTHVDQKPLQSQSTLGDLMALNASFSSPQPTSQGLNPSSLGIQAGDQHQQPQLSSSTTGLRHFKPSSAFGQSVIKEEEPQQFQTSGQAPPQQQQVPFPQEHASRSVPHFSNSGIHSPAPTPAKPETTPSHFSSHSTLPNVPNFASVSLPQPNVKRDLYSEGDASLQLSQATTDLANLSNQVGSLTNQATMVNEKKSRAQQELQRVNDLKSSIQSKMVALRASYEKEVQQTDEVENTLNRSRNEVEQLKSQLALVEANYNTVSRNLTTLQQELEESETANAQLKEKIGSVNALAASLQTELGEKQQKVKQERSMVDVNSKQLDVSQLTVANMQSEIQGLGEQLAVFMTKHKELDDYKRNLEEQHGSLNARHQEVEGKHQEVTRREEELQQRTKQIGEQETIYHQQVARLQQMFDDLNKQRDSLSQAEEQLQQQHMEYAKKVQELSENQMKLAMGEIPQASQHSSKVDDHITKYVDEAVTNSKLGSQDEEDKQGSDVFDKDFPTYGSQTEIDENETRHDEESAAEALADRFDGDLNEYGIPRTDSVTSSVFNNPPQSVRDDSEAVPQQALANEKTEKRIPGGWSNTQTEAVAPTSAATSSDIGNHEETVTEKETPEAVENPVETEVTSRNIDQEFPPIQELDLNESDSTESDDEFQDSKDELGQSHAAKAPKEAGVAAWGPRPEAQGHSVSHTTLEAVQVIPDEGQMATAAKPSSAFDDEFAGLETAAPEEEEDLADKLENPDSAEGFEKIEHKDLDDELQQTGFTGSEVAMEAGPHATNPGAFSPQNENARISNDEWDEIFAGFGNGPPAGSVPSATDHGESAMELQQPVASKPESKLTQPPVKRAIATTPKSLAIEELSGMGFTEEEATKALKQCNWDLEEATNVLLDS
ncbi:LAMI_0C05314g1_1 [Lachancea mirantina]|uniref:LAMI_0C05314g1_1 n=1 Tax=Lachancea mirantina TaxID=1230905 RepID=A0A1G4J353_9SACH|nr:LAMI_0C05314g1_1 [Lachancea mirantina]